MSVSNEFMHNKPVLSFSGLVLGYFRIRIFITSGFAITDGVLICWTGGFG